MAHRFVSVFLGSVAVTLAALVAPTDPAMAQGLSAMPRYEVTGFRGARFGMTEQEVRQAAKRAFAVEDGDMTQGAAADDGTTRLIVHVPSIDSALGAGRVEYFFGYRQQRLFRVNVVWGLDTNPNGGGVIAGAVRLQDYFLGYDWANHSVRTGVPLDDRAVLLFSGADGRNGAVTLTVENVQYRLGAAGSVTLIPEPRSRPRVTISYTDQFNAPDVRTIARGEF